MFFSCFWEPVKLLYCVFLVKKPGSYKESENILAKTWTLLRFLDTICTTHRVFFWKPVFGFEHMMTDFEFKVWFWWKSPGFGECT